MKLVDSKVVAGLARRYPEVAALVQQRTLDQTVIAETSMRAVTDLVNALHFVTEQANAGNAQARSLLQLLTGNLDQARAAASGIVTPNGA